MKDMSTKEKIRVKYANLHFHLPTTPMQFVSMMLIGEFYAKSKTANWHAFKVICMLTGYGFCVHNV